MRPAVFKWLYWNQVLIFISCFSRCTLEWIYQADISQHIKGLIWGQLCWSDYIETRYWYLYHDWSRCFHHKHCVLIYFPKHWLHLWHQSTSWSLGILLHCPLTHNVRWTHKNADQDIEQDFIAEPACHLLTLTLSITRSLGASAVFVIFHVGDPSQQQHFKLD